MITRPHTLTQTQMEEAVIRERQVAKMVERDVLKVGDRRTSVETDRLRTKEVKAMWPIQKEATFYCFLTS